MQPEWTPEEEEQAKRFAQKVVDRGMAVPAVLFLESIRPLHFIGGQFLHFMAPISSVVVGKWDLDRVGNFLEHRGAVPFVIDEIHKRDRQRQDDEKKRKQQARQQDTPTPSPSKRAPSGRVEQRQAGDDDDDSRRQPPESPDTRR